MKLKLFFVLCCALIVSSSASYASIGWAGNIWPCQYVTYSDNQDINVYVQVWKGGCTDSPGPCADVSATLLYKRVSEGSWTSVGTTYQGEVGSNDEWVGTIPASATEAGDPTQYAFVVIDLSDNAQYTGQICTQCECFDSYQLTITPATEQDVTVHFSVDMNCLSHELYSSGVSVAGDFQGWSPCTSFLSDGDNDGIYEGSWLFLAGSNPYHEFKYNRAGTDGCQWEGVSNRSFVIDDSSPDMYLGLVKWDNYECCTPHGPDAITGAGYYCLTLCPCNSGVLSIPLAVNPANLDGFGFQSGCNSGVVGCNEDCEGGAGNIEWGFRQDAVGNWFMDVCLREDGSAQGGCFCLHIDRILPVEFGSFDAIAGNNQVQLNWNTITENNNERFEISRNGTLIAQVASLGNSSTGHRYSYTDNTVMNGQSYSYSLASVDLDGTRHELATTNATPQSGTSLANEYALGANYPNPFNPTTSISYSIKEAGLVNLSVFDINGRAVSELVNSTQSAGTYQVTFDGKNLSSGVYYYRLSVNGFTATNKMVLMK